MQKTCLHCKSSFEITQIDLDFYDKISPIFAGEKFPIPTPTLCPDCRQRRRLSFRNERRLYKRKCDASGKDIISIYVPGSDYIVYDQKIRWSDDRDPMKYGRDFDFTKSFTEQFGELMRVVPHPSMISTGCEGCDYTCFTLDSKHSYMSSGITRSENILYSNFIRDCENMVDCSFTYESQNCYECVDGLSLYSCVNTFQLHNCKYCYFCYGCENCSYCIGCYDLKHKNYYYMNEFIGKDRYEELLSSFIDCQTLVLFKKNIVLFLSQREVNNNIILSENVSGRNISESINCIECMDIKNGQDSKYIYFTPFVRDSQDCVYTAPRGIELCYDVCSTVGVMKSAFTFLYRYGESCYYLIYCKDCSNCFGCIGLRNKQYCIFNKQYTKEDYEIMVGKIIRHMQTTGERGEFFHPSLSPFGYNETVAQEYYPLSQDLVGTRLALSDKDILSDDTYDGRGKPTSLQYDYSQFGYHRSTYVASTPQVDKVIKGQDLPDTIDDVSDDILKMAVLCEVSNKPFRITPQELAFYRKHHIPLPRKHPDVRHEERMKLRR